MLTLSTRTPRTYSNSSNATASEAIANAPDAKAIASANADAIDAITTDPNATEMVML